MAIAMNQSLSPTKLDSTQPMSPSNYPDKRSYVAAYKRMVSVHYDTSSVAGGRGCLNVLVVGGWGSVGALWNGHAELAMRFPSVQGGWFRRPVSVTPWKARNILASIPGIPTFVHPFTPAICASTFNMYM